MEYQQGFTGAGARLCLVCLAPVADCPHPPAAVLPGAMDLFCGCAATDRRKCFVGFTACRHLLSFSSSCPAVPAVLWMVACIKTYLTHWNLAR